MGVREGALRLRFSGPKLLLDLRRQLGPKVQRRLRIRCRRLQPLVARGVLFEDLLHERLPTQNREADGLPPHFHL